MIYQVVCGSEILLLRLAISPKIDFQCHGPLLQLRPSSNPTTIITLNKIEEFIKTSKIHLRLREEKMSLLQAFSPWQELILLQQHRQIILLLLSFTRHIEKLASKFNQNSVYCPRQGRRKALSQLVKGSISLHPLRYRSVFLPGGTPTRVPSDRHHKWSPHCRR